MGEVRASRNQPALAPGLATKSFHCFVEETWEARLIKTCPPKAFNEETSHAFHSAMSKAGSGGTHRRGLGAAGSSGEVSRARWVTVNRNEVNQDEAERLIGETGIAPLASDFIGGPAKKTGYL